MEREIGSQNSSLRSMEREIVRGAFAQLFLYPQCAPSEMWREGLVVEKVLSEARRERKFVAPVRRCCCVVDREREIVLADQCHASASLIALADQCHASASHRFGRPVSRLSPSQCFGRPVSRLSPCIICAVVVVSSTDRERDSFGRPVSRLG